MRQRLRRNTITKFSAKANGEFSSCFSDGPIPDRALTACTAVWDAPTMTLTADSKKRVVLPDAAPGDVFTCERKGPEFVLRRVHRTTQQKKRTRAQALKAIRNWKSVPKIRWEELRKMTREV